MKVLNLYEWAQALYLSGDAETQEYAKEIMDNFIAAEKLDELYKLQSEIAYQAEHSGCKHSDPEKQIEWLGDRSDMLEIIKDILRDNQMEFCIDPDDTVRQIVTDLKTLEGVLQDAGRLVDCDVGEAVLQLLDEVKAKPAFDL